MSIVVEVAVHPGGFPRWQFVGLAQGVVRESKARIYDALKSEKVSLPRSRVTISLRPTEIPKQGSGLDLPVVLALLVSQGLLPQTQIAALGEIGLDGKIYVPQQGFALAHELLEKNLVVLLPIGLQSELENHPWFLRARFFSTLGEVIAFLRQPNKKSIQTKKPLIKNAPNPPPYSKLSKSLLHILEIVLVGGHHALLFGSPGVGKSAIKPVLEFLLPEMSSEEEANQQAFASLEDKTFTRIITPSHAIAPSVFQRILSAPKDILFLDELPEFRRECREVLRQFSEIHPVTEIGSASFTLFATANPCPCGYFGTPQCRCRPDERLKYLAKISGPLLDRIAIQWRVTDFDRQEVFQIQWESLRQTINVARQRQRERHIEGFPLFAREYGYGHLQKLWGDESIGPSQGSFRRTLFPLQVAQTLADLQGVEVKDHHLWEAKQLVGQSYWESGAGVGEALAD